MSGPTRPDSGDHEAANPRAAGDPDATIAARPIDPDATLAAAVPAWPPAESPAWPPADVPARPPGEVVRYGPGIPGASQAAPSRAAEDKWRTGRLPGAHRRPGRLRRVLGALVTVALLAASGVVLYLRLHHAPFHVTGATITQQTPNGCGVNVTARISTNGAAGTVSYQWVFRGDQSAPVPVGQSVVAGQHSVYVTVAVKGSGHGTASQQVSLQVLGPEQFTSTSTVQLKC